MDEGLAAPARELERTHGFQQKVEAFPADGLSEPVAADRLLVLNNIKSQLLTLETIRQWEKNPDNYSSGKYLGPDCGSVK